MNCDECREQLVAYAEGLLEPSGRVAVEAHVRECPACRAEAEAYARLHDRLTSDARALAQASLETQVMDRVLREQTHKMRRIAMRVLYGKAGMGLVAAAAVALVVFLAWPERGGTTVSAAEVIREGIAALANLQSVYLKLNMRTSPRDNFELIGVNYDFVPIELWKQFSDPPRWRAEEPGRIVVMDGQSTVALIKPDHAYRQGFSPAFRAWVGRFMDVHKLLDTELPLAQTHGSVVQEQGPDGNPKLVVTVEEQAQGEYTNDWLKNTSIADSDHRRVYRFDAQSHLLEDARVFVHTDKGDVLVLEIAEIQYNQAVEPSLFALQLPDNVIWFQEPQALENNQVYAAMSPDAAARAFFQACSDQRWDEVLKFWPTTAVSDQLKEYLGGLEIVSIGKPFQSGLYPGWFVPYEIKLQCGEVKKFNLAVRNDNPTKRYIVDGGF